MNHFKNSRRSFLTRTSIAIAGVAVGAFKPVLSFAQSVSKQVTEKVSGMFDVRSKIDPAFASMDERSSSFLRTSHAKNLIVMGWADPFYPDPTVPEFVLEATIKALKTSGAHYTLPIGLLELRQAIARKLLDFNGIVADPQKEIIVTPGSDTGLYYAMRPFITPGAGHEVLIPEPSYPNNFNNTILLGAKPVSVPLIAEDGFQLNIDEFEKRVTDKTKLVVLTHPNNPTMKVYSRENMEALSQFVIKHDLMIVVDQAFEQTIFDNREFISIATLPGMKDRTVSVFSISKGLGLSGFRVGYIHACEEIMGPMYGAAVNILGATNTAAQYGAIAALDNDGFVKDYNHIYDERRKLAFRKLNEINGVSCLMPESGFMIWVNVSKLGTGREVTRFLAEDANVRVSPGDQYGTTGLGAGYLRIVLGVIKNQASFEDALGLIVTSLGKLSKQKGL